MKYSCPSKPGEEEEEDEEEEEEEEEEVEVEDEEEEVVEEEEEVSEPSEVNWVLGLAARSGLGVYKYDNLWRRSSMSSSSINPTDRRTAGSALRSSETR